jgi:hypothetical protein
MTKRSLETSTNLPIKKSYLKDLILLFAVPIGVVLVAALVAYVPRLTAHPSVDFVYTYCSNYYCKDTYVVDQYTHPVYEYSSEDANNGMTTGSTTVRYYDAARDATRSLSYTELTSLNIDTSSKSPEGYTLTKNDNNTQFLFFGSNDNNWYLKNGVRKKKVVLSDSGSYYSNEIKLLGWVKK